MTFAYRRYYGLESDVQTNVVNFPTAVSNLSVYTAIGSNAITASRNIGSTTIQSSGASNTFNVSGFGNYTLIGQGLDDQFFVTPPSIFGESINSATTITDLQSNGTGTLEVNDADNSASLVTGYVVTQSGMKRTDFSMIGGQSIDSVATVTFNSMQRVTYDTGMLTNDIDIEGTQGTTTFYSGTGDNHFEITPVAQNLDTIASPLILFTRAGSYNSLEIFDKNDPKRKDYINVSPGNVVRDSIEHTATRTSPSPFIFHLVNIDFNRLNAISITAPGANLADMTSPFGNVYYATRNARLDARQRIAVADRGF